MSKTSARGTLDNFIKKGPKSGTSSATTTKEPLKEKNVDLSQETVDERRLSIERIYQKKTQLEHILLRPDTYIGSIESTRQPIWVNDSGKKCMVLKEISFVPGLYKIFDEILVNAADNKQRDPNMNCIRIDIEQEENKIRIYNNGCGIPVAMHKEEKMYVPTLIFGHLLTSSNYDDKQKKVTGGRNGYGAKLCNIFSKKFIVETSSKKYEKQFKQTWKNNMGDASEPIISNATGEDFTRITFHPDLEKFGMDKLDDDIVALFTRRAYDIAGSSKGVKVYLNGERLPVKSFKDYVAAYLESMEDDDGGKIQFAFEESNERWHIAVAPSDKGFQQVSFVNSIATMKGGTHVDHVTDQIVGKIVETLKKKDTKKKSVQVKPFQVKNHLWVFVNCLIENPSFDSQTKENMTLPAKNFGSKCIPSEGFFKSMFKSGIMEKISEWMKFKEDQELKKKGGKKNRHVYKEKLIDAEYAGTAKSIKCTLILTEGDSALNLFKTGRAALTEDERKFYGAFPLRGKLLNVRDASFKQIKDNKEIGAICEIVGLDFGRKYEHKEELSTLRYGKIMIMTDQDHDGSHIKGLIINFIHFKWPNLLKHDFLEEFITPICKAKRKGGKEEKAFFSIPELEEWQAKISDVDKWEIKYYKGLGTSEDKESLQYFSDLDTHRIKFRYEDRSDDESVELAFSKKLVEQRKEWLMGSMEEKKRRREMGLKEDYLYHKGTQAVTYRDFVHKELVLFSNLDNERSIPSLMDGFKPTQRKVIYTCFKFKYYKKERKLNVLAGDITSATAYHHGESSLHSTIGNLAQTFVGSNNINLLVPKGQFGSRNQGGKDISAPRYISTHLSTLARKIFPEADDALLNYLTDDNKKIEPEFYVPIIPMVLINGAEGIGTGWSTKVPNYNPRDIVENLRRMIKGEKPIPMKPWYKGFKGRIEQIDSQRFVVFGEIAKIPPSKDYEDALLIRELPVRVWTDAYKEKVLMPMTQNGEKKKGKDDDAKKKAPAKKKNKDVDVDEDDEDASPSQKVEPIETNIKIEGFVDRSSLDIQILVKLNSANMKKAMDLGVYKVFKLQTTFTTTSMVLFDNMGCLRRYDSAEEVIEEFFKVRLDYYKKRKAYLLGLYEAEAKKLKNQCRFILEKNEGKLKLERVKTKDVIQTLITRGYDSDPVKEWRKLNNFQVEKKQSKEENEENETEKNENDELADEHHPEYDFSYLFDMSMRSTFLEREKHLNAIRDRKLTEIEELRKTPIETIWMRELDDFLTTLDEVEAREAKELSEAMRPTKSKKIKSGFEMDKKANAAKRKAEEEAKLIANAEIISAPMDLEKFKKKETVRVKKEGDSKPTLKGSAKTVVKKEGSKRRRLSSDSFDDIEVLDETEIYYVDESDVTDFMI